MIELRTLGAVDLRDLAGHEVRPVLQQPKRLALLVFLATDKPGRMQRRDSLLAQFWPDLDQEHARAALRRALYFLRQACGPELFVSRGDDEIGVDAELLWCDAIAFDEDIRDDRLGPAMDLYLGGFLEGFYVQGAPEAEAWLDRERARRSHDAADAAWRLASNALVDPAEAQRWARRAIELAPYDEESLTKFLLELESLGERGAGLRIYDAFAQRLLAELGSSPGPDLAAVGDRLRAGPRIRAVTAASRPLAADPTLIAVCPFTIRGTPDLAYLGEGMVDLLSTKLDGTGELRTVGAATVLRLSRSSPSEGADPARGGEIARELGAGSFVTGTLVESGGRIEATIGLHNHQGALRARVEARAESEAGLFELVDELVRRLVVELSQGSASRLARLAAITTTSLPALKAHLAGEHEFRLGRHLQALDAYRRATNEDPSFGLAYYRMASSLAASALIGPARQSSAEAWQHRDRLSDHDRLLLEAQHAWLSGATADAERRYAALTSSFPEHLEPWFLLGDLLFHSNPYRGRSIAEAGEPFERTLAIDPTHLSALTHSSRLAALAGRHDDLVALVDRALALSPSADQALGLRALRAFALGQSAEQRAVVAELARAPGLAIARAFSDVALYTQDWAGAEALARSILPAARSVEFEALGQIMLAHLAMARGQRDRADHLLSVAGRHEPVWSLEVRGLFAALPFADPGPEARRAIETELRDWDASSVRPSIAIPLVFHDGIHPHLRGFLLGLLRARAGDASGVVEEAEALGELPVPQATEALIERLVRTLDAEALRLQGKPAEALAVLERLKTDVWFQFAVGSPFFAGTYDRFLRAELLVEAGRIDEAMGWWEAMAQRSPYELVFLAEAERRQAAELSRRGRIEAARRHEARANALWTGNTT